MSRAKNANVATPRPPRATGGPAGSWTAPANDNRPAYHVVYEPAEVPDEERARARARLVEILARLVAA